jgi:hypothetical protein
MRSRCSNNALVIVYMISAGASLRQTNTFRITRIGVSEVAVSQRMVVLHHLFLNGLPEPPHRRGSPPVARWLITLGSWKLGGIEYISLGFISISISRSVKRSQKPMKMSTINDYEDRNSPPFERRVCSLIALSLVQATAL